MSQNANAPSAADAADGAPEQGTRRSIRFPEDEAYYEVRGHRVYPGRKVAIVGFASSSRNDAPFNDPTFEVWGLNSLYAMIPNTWRRWFEIHPKEHFTKDLNRAELKQIGVDHFEWLKSLPGPTASASSDAPVIQYRPVYMQEAYEDIPASVAWPRDEINEWSRRMFGQDSEVDYFTSTPGQMVATAIFFGFSEIHLYGVDLLQDEEYAYQRPGCEYWLGIARGMGIKVVVPKSSALLKASYVYGYTEPQVEFGKVTPLVNFTKAKAEEAEQGQQQIVAALNTINGAGQMRDAIEKMVTEAKFSPGEVPTQEDLNVSLTLLRDIVKFLGTQREQLQKKHAEAIAQLNKVGGQREVLVSMASWISHFGRGGSLPGM